MAWYNLFVLKVPLNTNQPTSRFTMLQVLYACLPAFVERWHADFFVVLDSDLPRRHPSPSSLIICSTSLQTDVAAGIGRSTGLPGGVGGVLLVLLSRVDGARHWAASAVVAAAAQCDVIAEPRPSKFWAQTRHYYDVPGNSRQTTNFRLHTCMRWRHKAPSKRRRYQ